MEKVDKTSAGGLACCQTPGSSADNSIVDTESLEYDSQANNNTMYHDNKMDEKVYSFPRRQSVDIEFKNVKYSVSKFSFSKRKFEEKEILHGIDGSFRSGELTAIMGPSGAGKSTLLNVLAGYVASGATGTVLVNGKSRSNNSQSFRNLSAYIHQDDVLRPWLTVNESMMIATHLKLGYDVSKEFKQQLIKRILMLLGLEKRYNTLTGRLSGGQKKRLAIALEMISNPPILFLDEPTTGLDSASCAQCISLLKRLAQEGRTIVATIHSPSALVFEMFDKLYALTRGDCIYQGPVTQLLPFLGDLGLTCPSYHNPADFLMEVAIGEYGTDITQMMHAASKKYRRDSMAASLTFKADTNDISEKIIKSSGKVYQLTTVPMNEEHQKFIGVPKKKRDPNDPYSMTRPASLLMQFFLLFHRNILCNTRNRFLLFARLAAHTIIAGLFGYLYHNVGPNANTVLANYVYLYGTILLVVYTGKMSVVMSFPVEMEILTREHFNRWYSLGPYFLSIVLFEIPFQTLCAGLYVVISYYLTGNFYEDYRFYYFTMFCIFSTLCAQSWGFFVGATLPIKLAVFVGPVLAVLFSVFGFCTRYVDITPMLRWMWHISYYRAGFHGIINTVYGWDRSYLKCPEKEMYCHFKNPKLFLTEMLISDISMTECIGLLLAVFVIMHSLTVTTLWIKLNKR